MSVHKVVTVSRISPQSLSFTAYKNVKVKNLSEIDKQKRFHENKKLFRYITTEKVYKTFFTNKKLLYKIHMIQVIIKTIECTQETKKKFQMIDYSLNLKVVHRMSWYLLALTCSKLTIVTLEQGVKYVQSKQ